MKIVFVFSTTLGVLVCFWFVKFKEMEETSAKVNP